MWEAVRPRLGLFLPPGGPAEDYGIHVYHCGGPDVRHLDL